MEQQPKQNLINYDRTWKTMVCINPLHELIKFDTNQIGDVKCPLCANLMVVVIKPVFVIEK